MNIPVRDFDPKKDLPYLNKKVLPLRIELATLLKKNILFSMICQRPTYWEGKISIEGFNLRVFCQYYCNGRKKGKVNYLDVMDFGTGKNISKENLKALINKLK